MLYIYVMLVVHVIHLCNACGACYSSFVILVPRGDFNLFTLIMMYYIEIIFTVLKAEYGVNGVFWIFLQQDMDLKCLFVVIIGP